MTLPWGLPIIAKKQMGVEIYSHEEKVSDKENTENQPHLPYS